MLRSTAQVSPAHAYDRYCNRETFVVDIGDRQTGADTSTTTLQTDNDLAHPRHEAFFGWVTFLLVLLMQRAFRAATLDEDLDECMVEMVTSIKHVRVDDSRNMITASMIFKWFAGDFYGNNQVCERFATLWLTHEL